LNELFIENAQSVKEVETERILSLDMSTKTGWSFFTLSSGQFNLVEYGQIDQIHTPEGPYPESFIDWANMCYEKILDLIRRFQPDTLVIEETAAGSKAIYTQKILEFIHFLVAKYIKDSKIKAVYIMTEQWRRETGCKMSKDESKHNKEVKKYKEKNDTNIAYNEEGKRVGKITRKHVNIRRANEVFHDFLKRPLQKKDEDMADSLLLGYSYILRQMRLS
jgi:hypothetical protein